ncbi:MAG: hypothetical protein JWO06_3176 [Bacteroidota bacterium]|nr:hypothetical protein [Bacteroidota bacterium]
MGSHLQQADKAFKGCFSNERQFIGSRNAICYFSFAFANLY